MVVKVLTLLLVAAAIVWMVVPRRPGLGRRPTPPPVPSPTTPSVPRTPRADDLEKCTDCGIWVPAGQGCDCRVRG